MAWLFGAALFCSAFLLFWIQPLAARLVLPWLGGSPSVWNTCMLFFQALLLAGYAYAHFLSTRFSLRNQKLLHFSLLALAAWTLPTRITGASSSLATPESQPMLWLLSVLIVGLGLPFFALSANAPLLQRWFGSVTHRRAKDPFFLYAASNAGSLAALLAFPTLLEGHFSLGTQAVHWQKGFWLLMALALGCAFVRAGSTLRETDRAGEVLSSGVDWRRASRWIAWTFVPSSWMLGVTTYLTTDVGSVPFFWILPLAAYLVTFVVVFARRGPGWQRHWERMLPLGAVVLAFAILSRATQPAWALVGLHIIVFLIAAMTCHGWLASDRPDTSGLTGFYLCLSFGGVLGGVFNAIVAPLIFRTAAEYPLILVAGLALWTLRTQVDGTVRDRVLDFGVPILVGLLAACLTVAVPVLLGNSGFLSRGFTYGLPLISCFLLVDRRRRFTLGLAAILFTAALLPGPYGRTLHQERNFFGITRVSEGPGGVFLHLVHGNTLHGRQYLDSARQCEPLVYYHRTGPLGDVMDWFRSDTTFDTVAAVGLGAGAVVSYSRPGERWTIYEIDPAVIRVATSGDLFTYLSKCATAEVRVIQGDARLQIQKAEPGSYGLMVLDAFSSDAIPVHLLTREAIELYFSKLKPGGLLAFHISNRYLELEPVLGALTAELGVVGRSCDDANLPLAELAEGKEESHWIVIARNERDLGTLAKTSRWLPIVRPERTRVWSDDFSDVLSAFKWR
jgi:hypothetical protein